MTYEPEYNKKQYKEDIAYIVGKAFSALKTKGILYFILTVRNRIARFSKLDWMFFKKKKHFQFKNNMLSYCDSKIDFAFANERTIEIPAALFLIKNNRNKKTLEIGNVLGKYSGFNHDIIDKYEKNEKVINADVISYIPNKKYKCIVSISTLEHVGFDEIKKNPNGFIDAINNIKKNCLKKGGMLIFTVPLGYNPHMDKIIKEHKIKIDEIHYFRRISLSNTWEEIDEKDALKRRYNFPYECANAILIGVMKN
ncbi:TPA: class I SAM-dependent methyltransferase [Candidatus Woesearchaeota archaeon]|nr:hypothetical protein [Candidatus Woesearchaeota archaeon]HIH39503.1 class I SAM-dependent methyltransferase [Candidatus Woesearchaeota archaeon]